ncbi:MAG: CBS domain-containing protein, partial [Nitrospirae bacterium]
MSNLLNNSFYGGTDRILFTTRVGEIAIKEVVSIRENATIQEAAQAMAKSRISSIIVMDEANQPAGIVTDRDLREKVIACGRDVRGLAATIMSPALIRADADEYCFDAVLKMIKHDAHQILIIKDGKFQGLLTTEDLMGLQGDSPFSFAREIEPQQTIEGIVRLSARLGSIVRFLIREGARAVVITRIMSELKDRLISKVLTMAEKHFGVLPASYCWITYGSEGRREQVLGMNFDSGLIYADPASPEQGEPVRKYFVGFAAFVDDVLKRCGF